MGRALQRYRKLFDSLKRGEIHPLYLLYGPEEYLKKEFVRELLNAALPEANRAFNLDVFHGDEFDQNRFDDRVDSYPLFSDRRVVILKDFLALSAAEQDHVISAARRIRDSLVLLIETASEKPDSARLRQLKELAEQKGQAVAFESLDEQETMERMTARFRREGFTVEPEALELLVASVGTQLMDLVNEVDKICLATERSRKVDREVVASVVGRYRTESVFGLLDALGEGDHGLLLRRLNAVLDGGEEPVMVTAMLLKRVVLLMEMKSVLAERGNKASTGRSLAGLMTGPVSPFYADVLLRQARKLDHAELDTLLDNLRWADLKLKTTQLDGRHLIEEALLATRLRISLAHASDYV